MSQLPNSIARRSPEELDALMRKLKTARKHRAPEEAKPVRKTRAYRPSEDPNYRLVSTNPGILDCLEVKTCARKSPGPGEVEIEVCAAGINFRDVMVALGSYPTPQGRPMPPMGVDCAGKVVRVGPDVQAVSIGSEVMCTADGTFSKYVLAHSACLMLKPQEFTFEQAAALPCVFATAQFALIEVANVKSGESVLIHSAAGGVGLAAIQVAQRAGATIYATVGTEAKREYIHELGVEHVFDSRSSSFADEILKVTNGQGVDVVLNSLAGEAIQRGFDILKPLDRFLELGKRDLAANRSLGMLPFMRGASFTGIDLRALSPYMRADISKAFHATLSNLFIDGAYKPLPVRTYPLAQARMAFSGMMQGAHIGKLVFSMDDESVMVTTVE